jgi:hypothetical protein
MAQSITTFVVDHFTVIVLEHIAWVRFEPESKQLTVYMTSPGPDGTNAVQITEPAAIRSFITLLGGTGFRGMPADWRL